MAQCPAAGLKSAREEASIGNESSAKDQKTFISPMLSVRNGAKAVEFYKAAFGAGELFRIENESRAVVDKNFSPESLGAEFRGGATVRMVMADPHAAFARAVKAGATVVWPVIVWPINVWSSNDKEYRWRVGRIVDPFGHHWEIGKPLADG